MGYKRTKVDYISIDETYYNTSVSKKHVHHIDGNSHNNDPQNLMICTSMQHAHSIARSCKGDANQIKLSLNGENRTLNQKNGRLKANETKASRELTDLEQIQLNDFRKKGHEAAKIAAIGSKKLIHSVSETIKFAKPNSETWFQLLDEHYITN